MWGMLMLSVTIVDRFASVSQFVVLSCPRVFGDEFGDKGFVNCNLCACMAQLLV